jgi:hypothetical protein
MVLRLTEKKVNKGARYIASALICYQKAKYEGVKISTSLKLLVLSVLED